MCVISAPKAPPPPELPAERQAQRAPDGGSMVNDAARRATDRLRARTATVLTSGSGVTDQAATGKKTLLGG